MAQAIPDNRRTHLIAWYCYRNCRNHRHGAGCFLVAAYLAHDGCNVLHQHNIWYDRIHVHRLCRRLRALPSDTGEFMGGDRDGVVVLSRVCL